MKLNLVNKKPALYFHKTVGPCFGNGGCDICIYDKCNTTKSNNSGFPTSFNSDAKYQKNQQTTTAFCGAVNGCKFAVSEYEVYRVIW